MKKSMDKMVLEPETYEIPDDYTAVYKNHELNVERKECEDVIHCKDCIYIIR